MTTQEHHISFSTRRLGGSPIKGGGTFRCSEVACSCGWDGTNYNGQTYAESVQEGREHLKEVGVYTTPLEQMVYAHITQWAWTVEQIAERSGKTPGRVKKVLDKLVERGNVWEPQPGTYQRTDKWFSWND